MSKIDCFTKHAPDLQKDFKKMVDDGMPELEAAKKLVDEQALSVSKELNDFKKSLDASGKKITRSDYVPTDVSKEVEQKKAEYQKQIDEIKNERLDAIRDDEQKKQLQDLIKRAESFSAEKLAEIISEKAQIPIEEATQIVNEVRGIKPKVRVTVGKPPAEPQTDEKFYNNPKAILNAIYDSQNSSEPVRRKFEAEGLNYSPQSHEESRSIAKEIIEIFGVENSIAMAESGRFDGDVNSMIFAEGIDQTFTEEQEATNIKDKTEVAEKWADYALRYDEAARQKGKFISAVYDFYKKSPLGVILVERVRRGEAFKEWFNKREKPFKEVFEELKKEPEFKAMLEAEASKNAEPSEIRKRRREKISNFFNKAKIGNKGINSSIIPPQIWDGAVEVMKQAFLAGETVLSVIEKGIKHINDNHNEAWDETRFQEEWAEKLKELESDQVEMKKEAQQKLLDKFRKKLSGLTETQKEDVIRKSFKKLVENGALEYDDFKKIVAQTLGLGELSAAEVTKIHNLIKDINAVQDASDNVLKAKTDEEITSAIATFDKAAKKAVSSATELAGTLYNKPNIGRRVRSIMQLNTLGLVSLIKNPFYNIFHQLLVRFPKGLLMTGIDQAIYGASLLGNKLFGNPIIKPDVNIFLAQKGYFNKGAEGGIESIKQVFTGLTNKDYFQKEVTTSQIKPAQSWRDLWNWGKGDKNLSNAQITDKLLQGTVGVPAEMIARGLNIGDKGFRFAAEGAIAETIASQDFNLKGVERERFIRFPKETAAKIFKSRGFSTAQAQQKAEAIENRIIKEGEEAVFQQENMISKVLAKIKEGLANASKESPNPLTSTASGIAKLAGVMNMPFVKTPVNVGWEVINLVNPELALVQSFAYGVSAAVKLRKGDVLGAREAFIQSKKWVAHAAVGWSLLSALGYIASIGAVSGDDEDEPYKAKEEKGKGTFEKPRRLNISKLNRAFGGESIATEDGDIMVDLSWFGATGMIMNMQANKYENMTKEEREQLSYVDDLVNRLQTGAAEGLTNSVFQGSLTAVDAIRTGRTDQWFNGMINVGTNFIEPAVIAQLSRASRPYEYSIKGDDLSETMLNNLKSRFFGTVPPKINIWGEEMTRDGGAKDVALRMLGVSQFDKNRFGVPIFEDFKRTGDAGFFPPAVHGQFSVKGKDIKLSSEETRQFQMLIGQARANAIRPLITGGAVVDIGGQEKKYDELNDEQKKKILTDKYEIGYKHGKKMFLKLNPKYMSNGE